jgi:hypothetical protein
VTQRCSYVAEFGILVARSTAVQRTMGGRSEPGFFLRIRLAQTRQDVQQTTVAPKRRKEMQRLEERIPVAPTLRAALSVVAYSSSDADAGISF